MHISKVEPKTVDNILQVWEEFPQDLYHDNIVHAALALLHDGKADYQYGGQWTHGVTWWIAPDNTTLAVNAEGEINKY